MTSQRAEQPCVICSKPATRHLFASCGPRSFDFKESPVCSDECLVVQVKELTNSGFLPAACRSMVIDL